MRGDCETNLILSNVPPHTGPNYRGQLLLSSRQGSSNASEGGANRESSLDDSGVVDDHEEQDVTGDPGEQVCMVSVSWKSSVDTVFTHSTLSCDIFFVSL